MQMTFAASASKNSTKVRSIVVKLSQTYILLNFDSGIWQKTDIRKKQKQLWREKKTFTIKTIKSFNCCWFFTAYVKFSTLAFDKKGMRWVQKISKKKKKITIKTIKIRSFFLLVLLQLLTNLYFVKFTTLAFNKKKICAESKTLLKKNHKN